MYIVKDNKIQKFKTVCTERMHTYLLRLD